MPRVVADYNKIIMTDKGRALQEKAQSGVPLKYTRFAFGSGKLQDPNDILSLNKLIDEKVSWNITRLEAKGDGAAIVETVFNNNDLTESFYSREIGLYAQDPDVGEILFLYGNSGEDCDLIPKGGTILVEETIKIITIVGNAQNVSAVINVSDAWVSKEQFDEHLENHVGYYSITPLSDQLVGELRIDFPIKSIKFGYYAVALDGKVYTEAVPINQPIRTSTSIFEGNRVSLAFYDLRSIRTDEYKGYPLDGQSFDSLLNQKIFSVNSDTAPSLQLGLNKTSELEGVVYGVLLKKM